VNLILTPCYDSHLHVLYVDSLIKAMGSVPGVFPLWLAGESLLPKARNKLFRLAYAMKECESILWIDADQVFTADNVKAILEDEHDFVTGCIRQKSDEVVWTLRKPDEKTKTVESCGMGFCKMSRKVMEKLWKSSGKYLMDGVEERNVFAIQVGANEMMSEDIAACRKWKGKIYYREDIVLPHVGEKVY
jgi:predicted Fe-S protein YdhL (DUF1289 family)